MTKVLSRRGFLTGAAAVAALAAVPASARHILSDGTTVITDETAKHAVMFANDIVTVNPLGIKKWGTLSYMNGAAVIDGFHFHDWRLFSYSPAFDFGMEVPDLLRIENCLFEKCEGNPHLDYQRIMEEEHG